VGCCRAVPDRFDYHHAGLLRSLRNLAGDRLGSVFTGASEMMILFATRPYPPMDIPNWLTWTIVLVMLASGLWEHYTKKRKEKEMAVRLELLEYGKK